MSLRAKFDNYGREINATKLFMFFQSIKMDMNLNECTMIIQQYGTENKINFNQLKLLLGKANK